MYKIIGQYEFHSPVFESIDDAVKWLRDQTERAGAGCVIGVRYDVDGACTMTVVSGTYKETFKVVKDEA